MYKTFYILAATLLAMMAVATSCIDDDFSTSTTDLLTFSTDTVAFDTVITGEGTATKQLIVYNRGKKQLNIQDIRIAGTGEGVHFYINVDGQRGSEFHDVEVRGEDSIYVFVEGLLDATSQDGPVEVAGRIEFVTNGVTQGVALTAWGQDVNIIRNDTVTADTRLAAGKPYQVYDTLVVDSAATLTLDPGVTLLFHDKAALKVKGKLSAIGTQEKPITMRGDRLDHVVGQTSFDIMSGQWGGVIFEDGSYGNEMAYVTVNGSSLGVQVNSNDPSRQSLHLLNCLLHNSSSTVLLTWNAWVEAEGCEFSEAAHSVVSLTGGKVRMAQCTMGNYYLFAAIDGAIVNFAEQDEEQTVSKLDCTIDNCIIYGLAGSDVSPGDLTGTQIYLRNCLLKSSGTDDANFINCKWGGDPKFYVDREKYIFDYRLRNKSDAIAIGNAEFCPIAARYDRYGQDRFARSGIDLGAYVWVPGEDEEE